MVLQRPRNRNCAASASEHAEHADVLVHAINLADEVAPVVGRARHPAFPGAQQRRWRMQYVHAYAYAGTSTGLLEASISISNFGLVCRVISIAPCRRRRLPPAGEDKTFRERKAARAQRWPRADNIANSFRTRRPETCALPRTFLATPDLNLNTPAAQAGLTSFISSLYENLFDRAPDAPGEAYWVGQLTSSSVGLGAAALEIANGATGTDAIEVENKIAVALDFTTRTAAAGLGETATLPASFVTAAHTVLNGVDGAWPNDASVTAGKNGTTAYISDPTGAALSGGFQRSPRS